MTRVWWCVLAAWVACAGGALWIDRGPSPLDEPTNDRLAALRIIDTVRQIAGDGIPRPAGSEHHAVVRQRLIDLIDSFGFEVETHSTRHHRYRNPLLGEVELTNLMFRVEGVQPRDAQKALLLTAHYDSSPQGPGAADDAQGVAILLEVARRLRESPPLHTALFLITDGEELGLLGADRWLLEHPWAKEIDMVVNVEARGSGGPSLMFQTSTPNRQLILHYARHVRRPRTSSLFADIYRILPNDTDLSVFLWEGIKGYNFAFIGNVRNYHTPDDTVENLNLSSLQHQADNVWQLTRSLLDGDWQSFGAPAGNVVYFDLFSSWVIWWPATWSLPVALLATLFWILVAVIPGQFGFPTDGWSSLASASLGLMALLLTWTVSAGGLWLLMTIVRLDTRMAHPWPDGSLPLIVSFWLAAIGLVVSAVELGQRWVTPQQWIISVGLLWAVLAIGISWLLVGGSYLWLVPLVAGCLTTAAWPSRWGNKTMWVGSIFALTAGLMWLPIDGLIYDALGLRIALIGAVRWTFLSLVLAPLASQLTVTSRRIVLAVLGAGWLVMTLVAIAAQQF
ncbi:MAG TPA: M28 family peptidase [Pirellulaceae bacterium]|nr:M28 family peptidase [Pirellulaceae bacterium]